MSIGELLQGLYIRFNAPSLKNKTNFFRLLALSQKAGLGIRDSLISIKKTEKQAGLLYIIDDMIEQLNQGVNFSSTLRNHMYIFKEEEISLITSAEAIGNLPDVLEEISEDLENEQKINQKIKKASTYPMVLLSFSIIAVVILLLFVIPTIVGMFPSQDSLPSITVFMLDTSDFIKNYWYVILLTVGGIYSSYTLLYKFFLPFKIIIDKILISVPVVSDVVKTFHMYRYSKLLGQLYSGGISPVVSLKLIANVFSNFHYKKKVLEIQSDMKSGFGMAESMEGSTLFDPILIQIISVGENTGNMADVLKRISTFYRELLQNKIDMLLALLEPFLMAFIAVIIGIVVGSIFIPMADMVNVMQ
ncbi:type II secretion system protein [candidate division SR1 bacterium RAAC1_SR1_1]|nr:type II secretion system protein [candidate division SR1 bacterium RAAC1_SR1_1]